MRDRPSGEEPHYPVDMESQFIGPSRGVETASLRLFQMPFHPIQGPRPHFSGVNVPQSWINSALERGFLSIEPIHWTHSFLDSVNSVRRRSPILIAVHK